MGTKDTREGRRSGEVERFFGYFEVAADPSRTALVSYLKETDPEDPPTETESFKGEFLLEWWWGNLWDFTPRHRNNDTFYDDEIDAMLEFNALISEMYSQLDTRLSIDEIADNVVWRKVLQKAEQVRDVLGRSLTRKAKP